VTPGLVFDSHALLRLFQNEPGADKVVRLLRAAERRGWPTYLCVINLGEILYATKRNFGDQRKIEVLAHVQRLGLRILPVSNELVYQAAELKGEYSISYADCFALACAMEQKAAIVTGDPDFKKVTHLAKVHWI
jgi:ribonuclease VapC